MEKTIPHADANLAVRIEYALLSWDEVRAVEIVESCGLGKLSLARAGEYLYRNGKGEEIYTRFKWSFDSCQAILISLSREFDYGNEVSAAWILESANDYSAFQAGFAYARNAALSKAKAKAEEKPNATKQTDKAKAPEKKKAPAKKARKSQGKEATKKPWRT